MAIMMAVFATMTTNQSREVQSLKEKLAIADFQSALQRSLNDGTLCTALLTLPSARTFDSTNAVAGSSNQPSIALNLASIPVNVAANAPDLARINTMLSSVDPVLFADANQTTAFQIKNIVGSSSAGIGTYNAVFTVGVNQSNLVRTVNPPQVNITLTTATVSGNLQKITACNSAATLGSGFTKCTPRSASAGSGWQSNATINCPTGETSIGGTSSCGSSSGRIFTVSGSPTANGWTTSCSYEQGPAYVNSSATAWAFCCK